MKVSSRGAALHDYLDFCTTTTRSSISIDSSRGTFFFGATLQRDM